MNVLIPAIQSSAASWSASIWRASLEGAVVIAIAMVIGRWCTFISPRIIHWIWRLTCLKVLVSFLSIQPIAIALLPPPPIAAATIETDTPSLPPDAISTESGPPVIGTSQIVAQVAPPQHSLDSRAILMLLWSIGLISCTALTLKQWRSARQLRRAAVIASSDQLRGSLLSEASRLGIRRLPQLGLSPHVEGPVLTGIWRPIILLPPGIDASFDESELRLMLAHELAHLKRNDLAWNWLPTIVGWLLFFHPLVWLMKRSWFEAQEAACDELLIQNQAAQPAKYGQLLLRLATHWPREPRTGLATAGVLGAYRNLQRRIIAMSRVKPFSPRRFMAAAALLFLIALAAIIPWRLVAQEQNHDQKIAEPAAIKISNVEFAKSKPDGAVKIHFDVDAPAGTFFHVSYNHRGVRGAAMENSIWKIDGDHGAQVDLTLSYLQDFKGDPSTSVLLSNEENLGYQIIVKHATTPGLSTIASAPLFNIPAEERLVTIDKSSTDWGALAADGGRRVFWLCKKSDAGKDPEKIEPRSELVVGIHDDNTTILRSKQTPFQEIGWKWKAQQYMIGAAQIKYQLLYTGASDLAPLPREKVNEILISAGLDKHPENFAGVLIQLLKPRDQRTKLTEPTEFYCLGPKTKEITSHFIRVFDGDLDLDYDIDNKQISGAIGYSSRTARTILSDFRIREPSLEFQPTQSTPTSDGQLLLRWDAPQYSSELIADRATGFIRRSALTQKTTRQNITDAFQYSPKRYAGGILFPTLLVRATYTDGILVLLELRMIESAQFNEPMEKNTFILPAKAGTYVGILDPGNPVAESMSIQLPTDVPNVAAYLRQQGYVNDSVDDTDAAQQTNKASTNTPTNSVKRRFGDTPTGRLLDRLQKQNAGESLFKDPWLRTLKEIVDLGPDAVPQLVDELDATNDDRMLRCLGFTLRAIDDKRAVPALIRAIPKTLRPAGSDMGLIADDPDLKKFAQQYELNKHIGDDYYNFGRPVQEIFGALEKMTGQQFGEKELYFISMGGTPSQQRMKRELFYQTAKKWADWWQQNAAKYTQDSKYSRVHLAEPPAESAEPAQPSAHYKTTNDGNSDGLILQLPSNLKPRMSFYDLDTGRQGVLPTKWRDSQKIDAHLEEILAWAAGEGFDLMGAEYVDTDGKHHFAIRPIGLKAWELPANRWKMGVKDITLEALKTEGTPVDGLLLHFDKQSKAIDPTAVASFFYITREGTPGILYVGVEVLDDSLKSGGIAVGNPDLEHNPVAFSKGRRFGYSEFEELTSKSK